MKQLSHTNKSFGWIFGFLTTMTLLLTWSLTAFAITGPHTWDHLGDVLGTAAVNITCSDCHSLDPDASFKNTGITQADLCMGCHDSGNFGHDSDNLPKFYQVATHSSPTYRSGTMNPIECGACHNPHGAETVNSTAHNIAPTSTTYGVTTYADADNRKLVRGASINKYFNASTYALVEPNTPALNNATRSGGDISIMAFNDAAVNDGICQVCHTKTKFHQQDNSDATSTTNHNAAYYCVGCHKHAEGDGGSDTTLAFLPSTNIDCKDCHIADTYGLGGVGRRTIVGTSGDFGQNPNKKSHHIQGTTDPTPDQCKVCHTLAHHTSGTVELRMADDTTATAGYTNDPTTVEALCLSCHDANGATETTLATDNYGGLDPFDELTDSAMLGSTNNYFFPFAAGIQSSWTNTTSGHSQYVTGRVAAGAELTCLGDGTPNSGCHGSQGAVNAHGSVTEVIAAATFNYSVSTPNGVTYDETWFQLCANCHNDAANNGKGISFPEVLGATGNYYDAYGGALNNGTDTSPPYGPLALGAPAEGPATMATMFRDHNDLTALYDTDDPGLLFDQPYGANTNYMNLHWFHLGMLSQHFRGSTTWSYQTCINCHNVHGSNQIRALYTEFNWTNTQNITLGGGSATYSQMDTSLYLSIGSVGEFDMTQKPLYCAARCHSMLEETRAWHTPSQE